MRNPGAKREDVGKKTPPNPIYIVGDLVEDILLGLPLKSILKFKSVSKQWRSIVESSRFAERRKMSVQKKRKILVVGDWDESRFKGDEEIEMVYLDCDDATRPSLTCDGLVCIPAPGWVNVLNPSTGELLRFPSHGPSHYDEEIKTKLWWSVFPGNWAMGFGRDQVNGMYKVVRMSFHDPNHYYCEILDVNIGEWRKLKKPPPYKIETTRKCAFVNGSIYWLNLFYYFRLLAFDLHTEEFRDVPALPPPFYSAAAQLVNLQDLLAVTCITSMFRPYCKLKIWIMDAQEESWSMIYSISLSHSPLSFPLRNECFTPLAVSKKGSLYFYDSEKKLFKYCPERGLLCLSQNIIIASTFVENLVMLRPRPKIITSSGYPYRLSSPNQVSGSWISSIVSRMELLFPNILLSSALASLVIFGYRYRYST